MSIQIHLGDCERGLKALKNESVDCIITSPPYKNCDNYSQALIYEVFNECFRVMALHGLCFVNFGHLVEDKLRPFRLALLLSSIGFEFRETFVWVKNHYRPIQGERRVNNLTEFIFMFSKGVMPKLDRLSIGIPYTDKSNVGRYADSDLKCAGNVWNIPYDTITSSDQKLHNDRFPLGLPTRCLKLAKLPNMVLDPFSGSGTTALACKQLGCNFVGWEIDRAHYDTSLKRLEI